MKNRNLGRKHKNTEVKDLDLAPMLSLMIAIIPVILASAVLFKIRIFDSSVFPASDKVMQKDGANDKPVTFLEIESSSQIKILIKKQERTVFATTKNLTQLSTTLKSLKAQYPDMTSLKIESNGKISYKELIKVFDIAKTPIAIDESDEDLKSLYEDVTLDDIFKG